MKDSQRLDIPVIDISTWRRTPGFTKLLTNAEPGYRVHLVWRNVRVDLFRHWTPPYSHGLDFDAQVSPFG